MLTIIAVLFGAICVLLLLKASGSVQIHKVLLNLSAALVAIPAVGAILMMVFDPPIGSLDETGIYMKSWGIGRIAWEDIESFSVEDLGEGGPIVSFHLRNEDQYLQQANQLKQQMAGLRQGLGLGPFVIYAVNVNQPLEKLVSEMRKRVQVRARVA